MTLLLSIDPGKATGIALGEYHKDIPYRLGNAWIIHGGVDGFIEFMIEHSLFYAVDQVVCERFVARDNGWVADIEAKAIEGALKAIMYGTPIAFQDRNAKVLVPDSVLKEHGLWQTGSMVGHTDGRDANDAIIHALGWLMRRSHLSTLEFYFGDVSDEK